jgi:hypothetical protein
MLDQMPLTIQHVAPINEAALLSAEQLVGSAVQYKHWDSPEANRELYTGVITDAKRGKFGIEVRIQPDEGQGYNLLPRWRFLHSVKGFVWFDFADEAAMTETEKAA